MKTQLSSCLSVASVVALGLLAAGCGTPNSRTAKPLTPLSSAGTSLERYQVATVEPFEVRDTRHAGPSEGAKLAENLRDRLKYDFGDLFTEVRQGAPLGQADELVVTGSITKYEPGSRTARFMLIGLGAASLQGELVLKDATSQQVVMQAPFSRTWAWGGSLGASKGIEEMLTEVGASAAATVARACGWQPKP